MNRVKRFGAAVGILTLSAVAMLVGISGPASAENPACPTGSGGVAKVTYNTYTSAEVCFKTDGDIFYYEDTHADSLAGGMYYTATDGLSHSYDYTYIWDDSGALNGWKTLNTNEVEGTAVHYRACVHTSSPTCGAYETALA